MSTNSRTDSWQVASLNDLHTCPPRRDNKLVTISRIAEKYEKFIMANPTWSLERMRTTIQEEMFAMVSISKLKRAKAIVMQKALDATKGQYQLLYRYQIELLRSNPGSTVIVKKELQLEPPVFQRMYICLDACKKGFMAGCRKVLGLDGCFFKGATNGELLCAIGRDANNQMYPIAWVVVEKENNEHGTGFVTFCSEMLEWEMGRGGLSYLINRRVSSMQYRNGLPVLNTETVPGIYMPTGERNSRTRSGKRNSGIVQRHPVYHCSILQGPD